MGSFVRILLCIVFGGIALYKHIDNSNELTELRLAIPAIQKEVNELNEENTRLQYDIDVFESPINLLELARKPEFGHLKYPVITDVMIIEEGNKF